nr:hypothetical protein JOCKYQNQ_JOCKYQNQ_CDS_0019 [Autographiviridae sp.]
MNFITLIEMCLIERVDNMKMLTVYAKDLTTEQVKEGLGICGYNITDIIESQVGEAMVSICFNDLKGKYKEDTIYLYSEIDSGEYAYAVLDTIECGEKITVNKCFYVMLAPVEEEPKQDKEEPKQDKEEPKQDKEKANYEIMVGLNDKDSHQQEVSTQEAIETVGTLLGSCTIQQCIGFYMGEQETSLKVTVYGQRFKEMKCTCQEIRRRLNQECVILTNIKEQESTFIYE